MDKGEVEKEYNRVKRSLEVLGYKDPLGIESVSLTNKLLNDLIKTTEAFKKLQDERDKLKSELKVQGDLILPLRNENMKLTKENNDLHQNLIQLKDSLDIKSTANVNSISTLEQEKEQIKFLLTQKDLQIKKEKAQNEQLKTKINELLTKMYYSQQNPIKTDMNTQQLLEKNNQSAINKNIKKGSFELSNALELRQIESNDTPIELFKEELQNFNLNKEDWANDLKNANEQAEKLRNEIRNLRQENQKNENIIEGLKKNLTSRDAEINRLQSMNYFGDDNKEEIKLRYNSEAIQEQNEKLQSQIDFLNKENHRLNELNDFHNHRCREEEVRKLDSQINELNKENDRLKKTIEKLADRSETASVITMGGTHIKAKSSAKNEINKLNEEIIQIRNEKREIEKQVEESQNKLKENNKEMIRMREDFNNKNSIFNSERMSLNQIIEGLKNENEKLRLDKVELSDQLKEAKQGNDNLKNEVNLYKSNELLVNKHIEEKTQTVQKVFDEYTQMKNKVKST